eukprot:6465165-Amphidinium_carterae.1
MLACTRSVALRRKPHPGNHFGNGTLDRVLICMLLQLQQFPKHREDGIDVVLVSSVLSEVSVGLIYSLLTARDSPAFKDHVQRAIQGPLFERCSQTQRCPEHK